jgi:hypothetical protein
MEMHGKQAFERRKKNRDTHNRDQRCRAGETTHAQMIISLRTMIDGRR